jgi:hypothetical protein
MNIQQILTDKSPRAAHMTLLYEGHFPDLDQARDAWKDSARWCCQLEKPAGWSIEQVEELNRAYFDMVTAVLESASKAARTLGLSDHVKYFEALTIGPGSQIAHQPAQIRLPGF